MFIFITRQRRVEAIFLKNRFSSNRNRIMRVRRLIKEKKNDLLEKLIFSFSIKYSVQ